MSGITLYTPTESGWQQMGFLGDFGYNQSYTNANNYPLVIGDFNGDGRTDVGRVGWTGVTFYTLTDSGWQYIGFLGDFGYNSGYTNANNYPLVIGDFNGDGRTDVGRVGWVGVTFYTLTDSGWQYM